MGIFTSTKMTYKGMKHERDDIYTYSFLPEKKIDFDAGQHGFLTVPGSRKFKPFSISSSPDDEMIEITTHAREESEYKQAVHAMAEGDQAKLRGPILNFTFKKANKDVVMLAMGVGITPFRSMLRYAKANNLDHNITLIHSDGKEPIFKEESVKLADNSVFPQSREEFAKQLAKTIKAKPDATFYISGSPDFLKSTKKQLVDGGISKSNLKYDKFIGY